MFYYHSRSNFQSAAYKFEPYNLIAEYLYNRKTELETDLAYEYDYLFRFRSKPTAEEVLHLYHSYLKYYEFCLICSDIFDIINLSERAYRVQISQT